MVGRSVSRLVICMCATTAAACSPASLSFVFWYSLSLSATYSLRVCVCCCPAVDIPRPLYLSLYLNSPPWPSLDDISLPFRSFIYSTLLFLRLHSHSDPTPRCIICSSMVVRAR
ncbi:hypothetical protein B0H14DRAFT_2976806, partial [Mycena olivaceomarginata]